MAWRLVEKVWADVPLHEYEIREIASDFYEVYRYEKGGEKVLFNCASTMEKAKRIAEQHEAKRTSLK